MPPLSSSPAGIRQGTRRARSLAAASHPEPTVAVTAMAVALAISSGRSFLGTIAVGTAVLAGQLCVGWHNDWLDYERDTRAARPDKPVARGDIGRRAVGMGALASGALTVPLSLLSGWRAGGAHIAAVALALAYNARLKATLASFVPFALSFPLLVAFVSLGRHRSHWPPWWVLLGAAMLGVGAHLANATPDVNKDLAEGIKGLPHRLGPRLSIAFAFALMMAASAVLIVEAAFPFGLKVALIAALVALAAAGAILVVANRAAGQGDRWARLRTAAGPRAWFRATMIIALADVAVLISSGSSL